MDHCCKSLFSVDIRWYLNLRLQIGPEPLPYTVPEDVEGVEQYILCSELTPLSPALTISSKVRVYSVLLLYLQLLTRLSHSRLLTPYNLLALSKPNNPILLSSQSLEASKLGWKSILQTSLCHSTLMLESISILWTSHCHPALTLESNSTLQRSPCPSTPTLESRLILQRSLCHSTLM